MHILWLKTELLHPIDKGGKIRTYFMLKELRRRHRITYLTLDDRGSAEAAEQASEYCDTLVKLEHRTAAKFTTGFYLELLQNLLQSLPYSVAKYRHRGMRERIKALLEKGDVDLLICDFLAPSVNVPRGVPCASLLFQHNVEAMIWERHASRAGNPLSRAYLKSQWRRMVQFEKKECSRYDHVAAVSREDEKVFREDYGIERVDDVPTGVDTAFFSPDRSEPRQGKRMVFTGSMDWMPNDEGIRTFIKDIFPLVRKQIKDATLTVVGRDPRPWLMEMGKPENGIEVTGRVEDVRPYMNQGDVFVVPLWVGGGTRLKLFEAMAMELPVVSTAVGAEGLPVNHEEHLFIADTPAPFADSVVELLRNERKGKEMAARASSKVRAEFSWEQVTAGFERLCEKAVRHHRDDTRAPE